MFSNALSLLASVTMSTCLLLICFLPAEAKTFIEHGPIQSFPMSDGWNRSKEDSSLLDPRQHTMVFRGPRIGTTLSFRMIRKPGRKISDEFESLIQQQPRKLRPDEIVLFDNILSIESINYKFTDGIGSTESNIQLQDPVIALLSGRHIIKSTYNYYFHGCSQTALYNGPYKILVLLADADGTGAVIEEISLKSKTQDYDEAEQQINESLAQLKWKAEKK